MKQIRVAIIGQGRSGRDIHGACLVKDPERFKIVAVVDAIESRRQRAAQEYQCDTYADYHELFQRQDLDLIVNASFSQMHAPITLDILNAGYNVLSEKPVARTVKELDELIAASKKAKRVFAIFQNSRFGPAFQQIQNVIASGVLGRIVQISMRVNGFARRWDWQTLTELHGGSLMNTGPHPIDQALVFFGKGTPKVLCFMDRANSFGDAEDYVKLILSAPGHPVIDLEISSCNAYNPFGYNVQGTLGGLNGTPSALEWKYYKPEEAPPQKLIREPICQPDGTPAYCRETLTWHTESWTSPAGLSFFQTTSGPFYSMLYNTLTTGAKLLVTPQQVRRQIAIFEKCRKQNPEIYAK